MQTIITFHEDGQCTALNTGLVPFHEIGSTRLRRVSHIWPCRPAKRIAFRTLRALFGERGRVAEWCRSWRGPWEVRFTKDIHRVVFSHPSRRVCIAWEIDQLTGRVWFMKLTTTNDQAECKAALDAFQVHEVFKPLPGQMAADGIIQLNDGWWLVGSNVLGIFTMHFLEEATNEEAWAFFDSLHGGCGHIHPRITIAGPKSSSVPSKN